MSLPVVEFRNVSKTFSYVKGRPESMKELAISVFNGRYFKLEREKKVVLDDVSFKIYPGEVVAIMGRNGTGKSTMMRILSGIYQPDNGDVIVRERIAAMVALGAGFHPELSGYENIFLNGSIIGIPRSDLLKLAEQIIEFSELGSHINYPLKTYSSGMILRLGFSVGAFVDAPIMVLDEILGVGDAGFQRKCLNKISELFHSGRTIILVTHDFNVAEQFCNRCMVLDGGKLIYDGPTLKGSQVYQDMFRPPEATS
jgi:ABC-type polysaccharide/polyol phosphate transport system ATPase subunit